MMNEKRLKQYEGYMAKRIKASDHFERIGNIKRCHVEADIIIVNFIKELGYEKLANLYKQVDKWYA